jgi:hypothetical protein
MCQPDVGKSSTFSGDVDHQFVYHDSSGVGDGDLDVAGGRCSDRPPSPVRGPRAGRHAALPPLGLSSSTASLERVSALSGGAESTSSVM